jgi:hypothetical protein
MKLRIQNIIPFGIRKWILNQHQNIIFAITLRTILKDPGRTLADDMVLDRMIYGWGNQGWSAKTTYLRTCIDYAWKTEDAILECGSGLTTIILGVIAKERGLVMISLEHNRNWLLKVGQRLKKYHLNNRLVEAPLKDFGEYLWYNTDHIQMPPKIGLVICDGPPASIKGGRIGLVPLIKQLFTEDSVILLDDMERDGEKAIASTWMQMYPLKVELIESADSHAIITMA